MQNVTEASQSLCSSPCFVLEREKKDHLQSLVVLLKQTYHCLSYTERPEFFSWLLKKDTKENESCKKRSRIRLRGSVKRIFKGSLGAAVRVNGIRRFSQMHIAEFKRIDLAIGRAFPRSSFMMLGSKASMPITTCCADIERPQSQATMQAEPKLWPFTRMTLPWVGSGASLIQKPRRGRMSKEDDDVGQTTGQTKRAPTWLVLSLLLTERVKVDFSSTFVIIAHLPL
jgi:hypothetical protein